MSLWHFQVGINCLLLWMNSAVNVNLTKWCSWPFDAYCCHMDTAIKNPVPDRVKSLFVIFDIRALWRSGLNPVWHRMLYSSKHIVTVSIEGLNKKTWMQSMWADWATEWNGDPRNQWSVNGGARNESRWAGKETESVSGRGIREILWSNERRLLRLAPLTCFVKLCVSVFDIVPHSLRSYVYVLLVLTYFLGWLSLQNI